MVSCRRYNWLLTGLCFLFLSTTFQASAQSWNEIFKQKKTQISYLGKQIAALQIYIGYARKGYTLVGNGINLIKEVNKGEFSLHRDFLGSLMSVSPVVKNSSQVAGIVTLQLSIIKIANSWKGVDVNSDEWLYLSMVKANLMAACASDVEQLLLIVTSGKMEMGDDERIQRLNNLHAEMEDKHAFSVSFSRSLAALLKNRKSDLAGMNDLEILYGFTP